jgi:hypothetical protein
MDGPMDFMRDQIWQAVGVLAGTPITLWAGVLAYRQLVAGQKALSCNVWSVRIVHWDPRLGSRLQVYFDRKPVTDAHTVFVHIQNSGRAPITVQDFERPLKIVFGGSQVLLAHTVDVYPKNLDVKVLLEGEESISLKELLLNPGDWILLSALVDGYRQAVDVDARIAGVKQASINDLSRTPARLPAVLKAGGLLALVFAGSLMLRGLGLISEQVLVAITFLGSLLVVVLPLGWLVPQAHKVPWLVASKRWLTSRNDIKTQGRFQDS